MQQADIVQQEVEIKPHEIGQRRGRAHTDDIDRPRFQDLVYCVFKIRFVDLLQRETELFNVGGEHSIQQIAAVDLLFCHFYPLDSSEPVADHFLHGPAHSGIAVIAQLRGKANHCRLGDPDSLPELTRCHKGGLIVIVGDILRDQTLSL